MDRLVLLPVQRLDRKERKTPKTATYGPQFGPEVAVPPANALAAPLPSTIPHV